MRKPWEGYYGVGKDMLEEDNRGACGYELINLGSSEVSAVAHHFVLCYDGRVGRIPAPLLEGVLQHETLP